MGGAKPQHALKYPFRINGRAYDPMPANWRQRTAIVGAVLFVAVLPLWSLSLDNEVRPAAAVRARIAQFPGPAPALPRLVVPRA